MRILLRKRNSGELLARSENKNWTIHPEHAWSFNRSHQAVTAARQRNVPLEELELVYQVRNREHMTVRLHDKGSTLR